MNFSFKLKSRSLGLDNDSEDTYSWGYIILKQQNRQYIEWLKLIRNSKGDNFKRHKWMMLKV
jgi:hypothetical protein